MWLTRRWQVDAVRSRRVEGVDPVQDDRMKATQKLHDLSQGPWLGDNANAFLGGFRLWGKTAERNQARHSRTRPLGPHPSKGTPG
jgi:hypothetical protein